MDLRLGFSDRNSSIRSAAAASVAATGVLFASPVGPTPTLWASEVGSTFAAAVLLAALAAAVWLSTGIDRLAWSLTFASSVALVAFYLIDPVRPGSSATEFSTAFFIGPAVGLAQIIALGLLARRVAQSVPLVRLVLDSIWLATAGLLITWSLVAGPVVNRTDIGAWPTAALVMQALVVALLGGLIAGLMILTDRPGRSVLAVMAVPAGAIATMQVVYGRAYIDGRLEVGGPADFLLPLSFSMAAVAVLEWRRSHLIRPRTVRPGEGQMAMTIVPLAIWGAAVGLSRLSAIPEQGMLVVVIGAVAVVRLIVLVSENAGMAADLHEQNTRDHLTGLPNLAAFEAAVSDLSDGPAGLILVDIDRFKAVNDTLGHIAGDRLLVLVGQRIGLAVGPGWTPARLAGAEFVVLTSKKTDTHSAAEVGRRIIERLSLPFHIDGREAWLGASVGVASTDDGLHPSELLDVADLALRSAAGKARGQVVIADKDVVHRARSRGSLEVGIRHAVERDEFFTVFQPKVDLATGAMLGVEALVRWDRPGVGIVPPDEFISVAEATGLISRIDGWVLADALDHLRGWNKSRGTMPRLKMSANMSAWQLARIDVDVEVARAISWAGGVDPAQVIIELTETLLIDDPDIVARRLKKLRSTGVGISVDDFGAGFTSVAYLRKFPVSEVKIDRDLVWELDGTSNDSMSLAAAVIALANAMDLDIVDEGVETLQQAESLRRLGARVGQGYLFAKPLRAEEIDSIITEPYPFAHLTPAAGKAAGAPSSVGGGASSSSS